MNIVPIIDRFLMYWAERFAWWSEYRGTNYAQLSRRCYGLGFLGMGAHTIVSGKIIVVALVTIPLWLLYDRYIATTVAEALEVRRGQLNPRRDKWEDRYYHCALIAVIMLICYLLLSPIFEVIDLCVAFPFLCAAAFFGDCNPMPLSYKEEKDREAEEKNKL